jgi:hypothetical protein
LVAASVIGVAPTAAHAIALSPAPINFGAVPVGTTKTKSVTLKLDQGYAFEEMLGTATAPFGVNLGTCTPLTTGSCKFTVAFSPTALGLAMADLAPQECLIGGGGCTGGGFNISGVGGVASVKPTTVDFGNVALGKSKTKTVTLTPDPQYQFDAFGGVSGLNAPFNVDPGTCSAQNTSKCKFTQTFSPTALGQSIGNLTVSECPIVAGPPCVVFPITFKGTGGAFSAKPVAVGSVALGTSKSKPMSIKFDTGYTLQSVSSFLDWSVNTNGCVAAVVKSCKVIVTLTATQPEIDDGTLTVTECPIVPGPCVSIGDPVSGHAGT